MSNCEKVENLFDVHVKASEELEKAVAEELKVKDPDAEKARAILDGSDDNESTA